MFVDDPTLQKLESVFRYTEIWGFKHGMRIRHWRSDIDLVNIERTDTGWVVSAPGFKQTYTHAQIHGCVIGPARSSV